MWLLQKDNPAEKATDIAQSISEQIAQMCQCEYTQAFVDHERLFCSQDSENQVIYQAQLLSTDGRTSEEIRNITQTWVLTEPFVSVSGHPHQLDPYCSVVIEMIGNLSCDPALPFGPTVQSSGVRSKRAGSGGGVVAYSIGIILLLSTVVAVLSVAIVLTFYAVKKYRLKKARDCMRYGRKL